MANAIFAFPNRVDSTYYSVAFSGGSWQSSLPLTNLRDPLLQNVARSTDVNLTSTKFTVDLGAPRNALVIALPKGNWQRNDRYKITGATDSGFTNIVYAGDWTDIFSVIYAFETLAFEDASWWDGKVAPEDLSNYPQPIVVVLDPVINARYWKFEFDATSNTDGYLDIARLFIASGWQPSVNFSYGAQLGWQTDTAVQPSLGGVRFYDTRPQVRNLIVSLETQDLNETLQNFFEMERKLGIDQQIMFVYDPDDTTNLPRRAFLATMSKLGPMNEYFYQHASEQISLVEVI